jgi:hypothetical protein
MGAAADRNVYMETAGRCRRDEANCERSDCRYSLVDPTRERKGDQRGRRLHVATFRCALAAADQGGMELSEVAACFGCTGSRIQQIQEAAMTKVRKLLELRERLAED